MLTLDKKIKKERRRKFKIYKKIIKARDIASKHIDYEITASKVLKYYKKKCLYWRYFLLTENVTSLSIDIYNNRNKILNMSGRPPPRKLQREEEK